MHWWNRIQGFDRRRRFMADVVIVNTCTVTRKAAMQSRQAVRQAIRANPGARIVVTGCHAQTAPAELAAIEGVDLIVGNRDKHRIPRKILTGLPDTPPTLRAACARTSPVSINSMCCPASPMATEPVRF
jgi:tRNA A37 methylthiotransferase MiaB